MTTRSSATGTTSQARGSRRPASSAAAASFPLGLTVLLLEIPLIVLLVRISHSRFAPSLNAALDLGTLPPALVAHVHQVLFVPLGALVVVFARLVLGVRALGVLSPILLALALPTTGYLPGLLFVSVVLAVVSFIVRPILKAHGLPYSARVAALLSAVAVLMLLPLLVFRSSAASGAADFAYFPVVALGLVTERFAATLTREGTRTTVERTAVTLAEAAAIAFVAATLHGADFLMHHPELLLTQIWCVLVLSRYLSLRLLEKAPAKRSRKRKPVVSAVPATSSPILALKEMLS